MLKTNTCMNDWYGDFGPTPEGAALWLNSCGQFFSKNGVSFINGGYSCPHIIEKGRGVIRVNGEEVILETGDMFCLLDDCIIEYQDIPDEPWVFSWVHLVGSSAGIVCSDMGFDKSSPWKKQVSLNNVSKAFADLREILKVKAIKPYAVLTALYKICDSIIDNPVTVTQSSLLKRAEEYMDSSIYESVNINELSRQLGVDRTTLYHAFKKEYDCSPVEILRRKRIEKSCKMLKATEAKLSVIAQACGFRSEKYFIRTFKKIIGVTPGIYRKSKIIL